jgi:hypothetical protein
VASCFFFLSFYLHLNTVVHSCAGDQCTLHVDYHYCTSTSACSMSDHETWLPLRLYSLHRSLLSLSILWWLSHSGIIFRDNLVKYCTERLTMYSLHRCLQNTKSWQFCTSKRLVCRCETAHPIRTVTSCPYRTTQKWQRNPIDMVGDISEGYSPVIDAAELRSGIAHT